MLNHLSLLPCDGEALLFPDFIPSAQHDVCFEELLKTSLWQNDEVVMFGKRLTMQRRTAWYGEKPFKYTYSKV